jgi:hypothetical protein
MAEPVTADAGEKPGLGEALARVGRVLFAPTATFEELRRAPTWGVALVLLCVLSLVIGSLTEARLDPESLRTFLEERGLSAEQVDETLEQQLSPSTARRYLQAVTKLGGAGLFYLAAAGAFWAMARLMGSELGYKQSLSTTVHGLMPFGVATLVAIPVVLSRPSIDFRETFSGEFLASHLGAFLGGEAGPVARAALSSVDLFSFWCIALLVVGFATVGRLSRGAAAVVALVPWLLAVAAKLGFAAMLGSALG